MISQVMVDDISVAEVWIPGQQASSEASLVSLKEGLTVEATALAEINLDLLTPAL